MKLLKTIRFDNSDDRVYEHAAATEEWAVSGAFAFAIAATGVLTGKARQAFVHGFLGLTSFGRSTFARCASVDAAELRNAERALACHLVSAYGAPDLAAALPAAKEEIGFALDLWRDAELNAVFSVRRTVAADGALREEFRIVRPAAGAPLHANIWTVVDDES